MGPGNRPLDLEWLEDFLALAGPGFRDFTRIAASDPAVWRDILITNREEVLKQSERFRGALSVLEQVMRECQGEALEAPAATGAWAPPAFPESMYTTAFLDIPPLVGAAGTVRLPGSKSISNRVLLLAGLAAGTTAVHDLLDSDDTRVMLDALAALGCGLRREGDVLHVTGLGGRLATRQAKLFLGNAGTAMRPLTAALAVLGGDFELRGVPRMHERPIGDLVDALRQLGCQIDYLGQDGYPPLHIGQPHLRLDAPIRV
eukprot:gene37631-49273_t